MNSNEEMQTLYPYEDMVHVIDIFLLSRYQKLYIYMERETVSYLICTFPNAAKKKSQLYINDVEYTQININKNALNKYNLSTRINCILMIAGSC